MKKKDYYYVTVNEMWEGWRNHNFETAELLNYLAGKSENWPKMISSEGKMIYQMTPEVYERLQAINGPYGNVLLEAWRAKNK